MEGGSMAPIIEIEQLTKKYGDFTAVNQLNLSINQGDIFGLLGPNGAGKSTTILMLMGLTEPSSGQVLVDDINPARWPIEVKRKVGYLPEEVGFYDDLSGLENLVYTGRLNGLSNTDARKQAEALLDRVGLSKEVNKKTGKYSRGMRQRLGLADVLIKRPKIVILDEPTLGIDPQGVREFLDLIVELSRNEKITVLFSSHDLYHVQRVCDRMGIFVQGKLLAEGNLNDLTQQLFPNQQVVIEAEIHSPANGFDITASIKQIEGVKKVSLNQQHLKVDSSIDVSCQLASLLVQQGFGLSRLSKKEFGLNDIYISYFEGGQNHD